MTRPAGRWPWRRRKTEVSEVKAKVELARARADRRKVDAVVKSLKKEREMNGLAALFRSAVHGR